MTGLSVDVNANTRAAQANVRDLSKAFDATSDALDDLARDGGEAGEKLERSFRDMVRESQRASRDIAEDARDTARKMERAYSDVGDVGGTAFRKVKDGAREVQQEMGQNLGETVSSIRGDLSDLGQVGQDTLGGLAATLAGAGPAGIVGAAAVAAGAVGLGLVTGELEKQGELADEFRDRISGAYQSAAEEGRDYLDVQQLIAEQRDLMFNPERAEEYKRIREDALKLGLDESVVIDANTGSLEAQRDVLDRINQLIDAQNEKPRQDGLAGSAEWDAEMKSLDDLEARWTTANEVAEQYAENARDATEQAAKRHKDERDQIERTARVAQERYEGLAARYARPVTADFRMRVRVDDREFRDLQQRAANGLRVSVTALNGGKTWE